MKPVILPICFILLVGFANAQNSVQSNLNPADSFVSAHAFIELPLEPHNNKIDIFFYGEKPQQDYYNIRVIDVSGGNSYQDLLNAIQNKAKSEGYDGLIILGRSNFMYPDYSVGAAIATGLIEGTTAALTGNKTTVYNGRYSTTFVTGQTLSAVGIKYKNNMQYINKLVRKATIYVNDSLHSNYNVGFLMNGDLLKADNIETYDFYAKNIALFKPADYFTTHAWHQNANRGSDPELVTTVKLPTDYGDVRYRAMYADDSSLSKVSIKIPESGQPIGNRFYDIAYDCDNHLIQKRYIREGRKSDWVFTDIYQYDDNKRCIGFTRYDAKTNSEVFKISYEFYSTSDLPKVEK